MLREGPASRHLNQMLATNTKPARTNEPSFESSSVQKLDEHSIDPLCNGCKAIIEDGSVVAFGDHIWHVACFVCTKCKVNVNQKSNLLLLGDGNPVCESCFYLCQICGEQIVGRAVMTGGESFHPECFRCKACQFKIEHNTFARTSNGVYCMQCYRERSKRPKAVRTNTSSSSLSAKEKGLPALPRSGSQSSVQQVSDQKQRDIDPDWKDGEDKKSNVDSEAERASITESADNLEATGITLEFDPASPVSKAEERRQRQRTHYRASSTQSSKKSHFVPDNTSPDLPLYNTRPAPAPPTSLSEKVSSLRLVDTKTSREQLGNRRPTTTQNDTSPLPERAFNESNRAGVLQPLSSNLQDSIFGNSHSAPTTSRLRSSSWSIDPSDDHGNSKAVPVDLKTQGEHPTIRTLFDSTNDSPTDPAVNSKRKPSVRHGRSPSETMGNITEIKELERSAPIVDKSADDDKQQASHLNPQPTSSPYQSEDLMGPPSITNTPESHQNKLKSPASNASKISRTLSMKHKRSHSDAEPRNLSRSPRSPFVMPKFSFSGSKDIEKEAMQEQLRQYQAQNSELSAELHALKNSDMEEKLSQSCDGIVRLERENQELRAELEILRGQNNQLRNSNSLESSQSANVLLIQDFKNSIDAIKQANRNEIESLLKQKLLLRDQNMNLEKLTEDSRKELDLTRQKQKQLDTMNAELTKKIQEQFKANVQKASSPIAANSFPTAYRRPSLCTEQSGRDSPGNDAASSNDRTSPGTREYDSVSIESGLKYNEPDKSVPPPARRFNWKKGVSKTRDAVRGLQATKGLNRLWASEGPSRSMSSNGLNIYLTSEAAAEQSNRRPARGFFSRGNKVESATSSDLASLAQSIEESDALFGGCLVKHCQRENREIPSIVTVCITEVENRGMQSEGIYRKSGGASQMRNIKEAFENGCVHPDDIVEGIAAVTSILKQYLRRLADPLIPFEHYEAMISCSASSLSNELVDRVKSILSKLPKEHWMTLQFLMLHLKAVSKHEETNLMNTRNLAVVFAPTILRDRSGDKEMQDMHAKNSVVQSIIDYADAIFD